jgi:glycosyltransferase involved in cell wall biosynthesis
MEKRAQTKFRKVLMLIENVSFPVDRRMWHAAKALRDAGYEVSVICPKGDVPEERSSFEVLGGVNVYRYPMLWHASGKIGYLLEYGWALFLTAVLSLVVWFRDGIDIVHSANPPDIFFLLAWPFKLAGKKYVYDEHDLCPELYDSKFQRKGRVYRLLLWLEGQSYRAADLVICPNQSYRDIARERGKLPDSRLAIVRNGVDIKEFHRRNPRPELKKEFPYLAVYLGVMGRQDGVDRIVRAADYLVHTLHRRDVLFVMIGKGECWNELQELSRELKVDDVVQFVGRISDDLLLDYLSVSDVCLAPDPPDRMNHLSTMTKIMEYMACGNAIVSFDLLESRRSAGDAAVYVAGDDPRRFAIAVSELLNDPARRERMAQIAIERSIQLVGLDRSRKALLEGYSRLSGRPRATLHTGSLAAPAEGEKAGSLAEVSEASDELTSSSRSN